MAGWTIISNIIIGNVLIAHCHAMLPHRLRVFPFHHSWLSQIEKERERERIRVNPEGKKNPIFHSVKKYKHF